MATTPTIYASCARNIQVTSSYVHATALCSCGESSYTYHTGTFKNYCPCCHRHGTLTWNPKGTFEGEWTCSACDADYCAADGHCKSGGSSVYLIPTVIPQPQKPIQAQTNQNPVVQAQSTVDVAGVPVKTDIVTQIREKLRADPW